MIYGDILHSEIQFIRFLLISFSDKKDQKLQSNSV